MQLKNNEIESYLKNPKHYPPVILVYGPDHGLVSERVETIKSNVLDKNDDPFAVVNLEQDDIAQEPGILVEEATTVALFGGERLIRLRLSGRKQITKSIKALLETDNHTAVTIIEAENLNKGNPIRTLIEKAKNAVAIPCYIDDDRSLRNMIQDHLQSHNLMADNDTIIRLMSLLGEDRKTSRNELEKLSLYADGHSQITLSDVENLIGDASATLVDETIDYILCGEMRPALANIQKSRSFGQSPVQLTMALQRHLLTLKTYVDAYEKGQDIQSIIGRSRPPIHFKRKNQVSRQIKSWSSKELDKALNQIHQTIIETRKNSQIADMIFENIFLRLTAIANRKTR